MENEQSGTYALVNPMISNDPNNRQGKVGLIVDANLETDDIWVSFGRDEVGLYSTNALLVLNKHEDITQKAMDKRFELSGTDFKKMIEIGMLANTDRPQNMKIALELAASSDSVLGNSVSSLQDRLGLEVNYEMAAGRRR